MGDFTSAMYVYVCLYYVLKPVTSILSSTIPPYMTQNFKVFLLTSVSLIEGRWLNLASWSETNKAARKTSFLLESEIRLGASGPRLGTHTAKPSLHS